MKKDASVGDLLVRYKSKERNLCDSYVYRIYRKNVLFFYAIGVEQNRNHIDITVNRNNLKIKNSNAEVEILEMTEEQYFENKEACQKAKAERKQILAESKKRSLEKIMSDNPKKTITENIKLFIGDFWNVEVTLWTNRKCKLIYEVDLLPNGFRLKNIYAFWRTRGQSNSRLLKRSFRCNEIYDGIIEIIDYIGIV